MRKTLVAAVGLVLLAGCGATPTTSEVKGDNAAVTAAATSPAADASPTPTDASPTPTDSGLTATFTVTTTGNASVSWSTGSAISTKKIKKGQWSKTMKVDASDTLKVASLIATNVARSSQTVTCEILLNGVSKAKKTAKGKIAIATCTASTAG